MTFLWYLCFYMVYMRTYTQKTEPFQITDQITLWRAENYVSVRDVRAKNEAMQGLTGD